MHEYRVSVKYVHFAFSLFLFPSFFEVCRLTGIVIDATQLIPRFRRTDRPVNWPLFRLDFMWQISSHSNHSTLLDVVLTTHPERFCYTNTLQLCISDHDLIVTIRKWKLPKLPPKLITYRLMKRFDADIFLQDLYSVPWDSAFIYDDIKDIWAHWYKLFIGVIDLHAPFKKKLVRGNTVSWIHQKLCKLLTQGNLIRTKRLKIGRPTGNNGTITSLHL